MQMTFQEYAARSTTHCLRNICQKTFSDATRPSINIAKVLHDRIEKNRLTRTDIGSTRSSIFLIAGQCKRICEFNGTRPISQTVQRWCLNAEEVSFENRPNTYSVTICNQSLVKVNGVLQVKIGNPAF
jgi:hypothetical protein